MGLNKNNKLYQEDLDYILGVKGIDSLRKKSILITGATGMVGLCLTDALMKFNEREGAGINLYVVGRDKNRAFSRLGDYYSNPLFHFIEQDVRDSFSENLAVDFIIPLASNTHPVSYSKFPVETIEINVKGAENALKKARQCGASVLYPSSVEVYGQGNSSFEENDTGNLNLATSRACYTESKRVCEALCQSYISEYGVDCKIVRLCRLFGPTMQDSDTKASSQFILNALAGKDIVLKSKGNQLFSYTYVADAVQAMLFVMINGECGQAFNVACDKCNVKLIYFAIELASISGKSVVYDIPSDVEAKGYSIATRAILSTNKLSQFGWEASYSFKNAIQRTFSILDG